jgi:hypothetical protein
LGRGLANLGGNILNNLVVHQRLRVRSSVHVGLDETSRTEGRVGGHVDALVLSHLDELNLLVVGVNLDLEGGGDDLGVAKEVEEKLGLEVGNTNALGQTLLDEALHGGPGLLSGGLGPLGLLAGGAPARRVADRGVDILEGDGEVDEEKIEVVDAPVSELAASNGLDLVTLVEGLPELGGDEEVLTLDEAVLDGASDTLTALLLVAVIYTKRPLAIKITANDFIVVQISEARSV